METCSSLSLLLLLLLGLSQAIPLQKEEIREEIIIIEPADQKEEIREEIIIIEPAEDVTISSRILAANKGSSEILLEGDLIKSKNRNAMICLTNNCFWSKSSDGSVTVPYTISNKYNSYERSMITSAMNIFNTKTCIRFKPRQFENDYISFESQNGCFSNLGHEGGPQVLSINSNGCMYNGVILHEILHALGFQHEHVRSDRDQYVKINWQNIDPNMAYNFQKENTNNLNTPYDYSSIMHYDRTAFSIVPGQDTITPIPNPNVMIGQRKSLSATDILRINKLYNC